MKIELGIIYECIQNEIGIVKKNIRGYGKEYLFPELYCEKTPDEGNVCVVKAESVNSDLLVRQDILIVCVGIREDMDKGKCQYIMTDGEKDAYAVYSVIADIFCRISDWKERIYDICMTDGSLQEILDASARVFSKELLYLNNRFKVVAFSLPNGKLKQSEEEYQEWLTTQNKDNLKRSSSKFKDMETIAITKTPYIFHYMHNNDDVYYLCISVEEVNEGIGRILVNIGNEIASNTQIWLIGFLRKALERYFRNFLLVDQNHLQNIQGIFYNIIDGMQFDRQMIEKKLLKFGSPANDRYICIKVALANADILGVTAIYLCTQIEQILGSAYAVQYDSNIVVLMNLTKNKRSIDEVLSEFVNMLSSNRLKAGICNEFNDIFKSGMYYLQAKKAYKVGYTTDPDKHIYNFRDYAVQYVLTQNSNELPVDLICAEGLLRLLDYEKASTVEYCKTLSTYLRNNMNAAQTAKMLYIHRSTLLFRLGHIKELLQMDFDDPDDRLYLEISLKLLGKYQ